MGNCDKEESALPPIQKTPPQNPRNLRNTRNTRDSTLILTDQPIPHHKKKSLDNSVIILAPGMKQDQKARTIEAFEKRLLASKQRFYKRRDSCLDLDQVKKRLRETSHKSNVRSTPGHSRQNHFQPSSKRRVLLQHY